MVIRNLHERVIDAKISTGANKGDLVLIPRPKLAPSDVNLPFTLERTQFPLRLSYCMTINTSQGQTFSRLGIFLPSPVFAHGQLYTCSLFTSTQIPRYLCQSQRYKHTGDVSCEHDYTKCCVQGGSVDRLSLSTTRTFVTTEPSRPPAKRVTG